MAVLAVANLVVKVVLVELEQQVKVMQVVLFRAW
jgi:hypothetical protein